MMTKRTVFAVSAVLMVAAAWLWAAPAKPKSVVHVITVKWKADATAAQIEKALNALENMNYPGLKTVWVRPVKMQLPTGYNSIFVMEFDGVQSLKSYADSAAQKAWYEVYMPLREESRTSDITN